jgi:hypothetical protein
MIYSFNTLGWYSLKANRSDLDNNSLLHKFVTNTVPAFQVIIDATITSATYVLYDTDDVSIKTGSCTVTATTNAEGTAYSILSLTGATTTGAADGKYYLTITYGTTTIYSDIFCWKTTVTDYLKISAVSAALNIGGFSNAAFTYETYFDSVKFSEETEIFDEGSEKTFGNVHSFVSANKIRKHEILGSNKTKDFLFGLMVIEPNGAITITWAGESMLVYDVQVEVKSVENNKVYAMELKYKLKDYVQSLNVV